MEVRITKVRVAMAALLVVAGIGLGNLLSPLVGSALATVGQTVNISDNSASAYFAKVDSSGALKTTAAVSGGKVAPAAPASPWGISIDIQSNFTAIAGPSTSPINITSLSVSTDAATGSSVGVFVYATHVPTSSTTCGTFPGADATLWHIRDLGDGVTPVSFTFPTPLQWKPPANTKACLFAFAPAGPSNATTMNAVGFYS